MSLFNESGLPNFRQMYVAQRLKSIVAAAILLCIIAFVVHKLWPKNLNNHVNLMVFVMSVSAVLSLIYVSDGGRMLSDNLGWIVAK